MTSAKNRSPKLRKWLRIIHRDLSYFFAGAIVVYALSGILMNHKDDLNPNYTVSLRNVQLEGTFPMTEETVTQSVVEGMLVQYAEKENYTKHYFPQPGVMKVFLKGGSSLVVDLESGHGQYERIRRRPILSHFTRLHYNPGKGWTIFADIFAVGLIIVTITGVFMLKGKYGLIGRGGIELLVGSMIPVLFILLV